MTREEYKELMEEIRAGRDDVEIMDAIGRAIEDYDYVLAERDNEVAVRDESIRALSEEVENLTRERDDTKRRYYDLYTRVMGDGEIIESKETDLVDDDNKVYETTSYEDALKDW